MGKSAVARRLATRLETPYVDVDREVEAATGYAIAEIWKTHGESHFRELELTAIREAAARGSGVVAVGAGALGTEGVAEVLAGDGTVIELVADIPVLVNRLGDVSDRPVLADDAHRLRERLEEVHRMRSDLYRAVSHLQVDTTDKTADDVCDLIMTELGR